MGASSFAMTAVAMLCLHRHRTTPVFGASRSIARIASAVASSFVRSIPTSGTARATSSTETLMANNGELTSVNNSAEMAASEEMSRVISERSTSSRSKRRKSEITTCLLYTSDAADEEDSVDLGG